MRQNNELLCSLRLKLGFLWSDPAMCWGWSETPIWSIFYLILHNFKSDPLHSTAHCLFWDSKGERRRNGNVFLFRCFFFLFVFLGWHTNDTDVLPPWATANYSKDVKIRLITLIPQCCWRLSSDLTEAVDSFCSPGSNCKTNHRFMLMLWFLFL